MGMVRTVSNDTEDEENEKVEIITGGLIEW